jgi:hypothetical protein
MAFVHGSGARLFLGSKHISGTSSSVSCSFDNNLAETTNLLAGGSTFIPGLTDGEISAEGFIEQQVVAPAVTIQDAIRAATQTDSGALFTAAPAGLAVGRPAFFCKSDISSFEIESSVEDAVTWSIEAQGDEGIDWGILLHDHSAVDADPANGAGQDNGAPSAGGGAALLHVTAVTGSPTGVAVKVQHSEDDDTYTDLISFTSFDDITAEFKAVTGTINQYVRAQWAFTGGTSPTATFVLAFARR